MKATNHATSDHGFLPEEYSTQKEKSTINPMRTNYAAVFQTRVESIPENMGFRIDSL